MGKAIFEINTPMPNGTTRPAVLKILRDHKTMIRLNPLTYEPKTIEPPPFASAEELDFQWYEITDRIEYLPGGLWSGNIVYQACFRDGDDSLDTHVYAPMGVKTVSRWSILEAPVDKIMKEMETEGGAMGGIYLKEEVELTCNFLLLTFVKGTLMDAHRDMAKLLGERARATLASERSEDSRC